MPVMTVQVATSSDDAHEYGSGYFVPNLGVIMVDAYPDPNSNYYRCAGVRLLLKDAFGVPVSLPPGTIINHASLDICNQYPESINCKVYGHAQDSSPTFDSSNKIIARARTVTYVDFIRDNMAGQGGSWLNVPLDITSLAQYMADNGYLISAICTLLLIANTDNEISAEGIHAWDWPGHDTGPILTIDYIIPAGQGILNISTQPVLGEIFVDSLSMGTAPVQVLVTPGTHTVSFGAKAKYTTPAPQTVTAAANEQLAVNGVYIALPAPATRHYRAMYCWWFGYRIYQNPVEEERLINICQDEGVNLVFFNFGVDMLNRITDSPSWFTRVHGDLQAVGIEAHAIPNDASLDVANPATFQPYITAILKFNSENPAYKFTGLHFDLEPPAGSSLAQHAAFLVNCLASIQAIKGFSYNGETVQTQGLDLSLFVDPRWNQGPCAIPFANLINEMNFLDIGSYNNTESGAISLGSGVIAIADAQAIPYLVTLETDEGDSINDDAVQSWWIRGHAAFEVALDNLQAHYTGDPLFWGMCMHHYSFAISQWYTMESYTLPEPLNMGDTASLPVHLHTADTGDYRLYGLELLFRDASNNIYRSTQIAVMNSNDIMTFTLQWLANVPGVFDVQVNIYDLDLQDGSRYSVLYQTIRALYATDAATIASIAAMTMDQLAAATYTGKRSPFLLLQSTGWLTGAINVGEAMANLTVNTTPVSGQIYIDGVLAGTAPITLQIPAGIHTITFEDVSGYIPPAAQTITLPANGNQTVTGTYVVIPPPPPAKGTLKVTTTPVAADIYVEGVNMGLSPIVVELDVGTYTVSFGDVAGYTKAADTTITLNDGGIVEVVGTYSPVAPPPSSNVPIVAGVVILGLIVVAAGNRRR
jgi:hypothetical protein